MKLRHCVVFVGLLVMGLAGGLALVPRASELALIDLRDKEFDRALQRYEQRLAEGDLSVSVVIPLCQLYLQFGKVESAVALMERFVRENPSNLDARRQLARYYQQSQRTDDYIRTLEHIVSADPSKAILRELSDIYNFRGDLTEQIRTLQTLTRLYPGEPQDLLDLASLQAAHGSLADAAVTLEKVVAVQAGSTPLDTVHFLMSVLLDTGRSDEADRQARAWLARQPDGSVALGFASLLSAKGQAAKALALLTPYEAGADANVALLTELTQLEVVNGKPQHALERLDRIQAANRLPDGVLEQYLDLLLTSDNVSMALEVAAHRDITGLPSWLLSNLADAAASAGRRDVVEYLARSLGDGHLDAEPLLGARVAIALGDRATAARRIAPIAKQAETPESILVALANLYLEADDAAAGLTWFAAIRAIRPSPVIDASWAAIESKAGSEAKVTDWLKGIADGALRDDVLENLYFIAQDTGKHTLASITAERLYRRRRGAADRLRLASAFVAAGRAVDALPHLRDLNTGRADVESLYVDALTQAVKQGAPVRNELKVFWSRNLAAPGLSDAKRQELVYALMDLGAYEEALPALYDLARAHGDSWLFACVDAATKSGRTKDLVPFLKAEVARLDLPLAERGVRLQLLREHGGNAVALADLRRFADLVGGEWAVAYEESLGTLGRRADLLAFWRTRAARADVSVADKRGIAFRSLEAGQKGLAEDIFRALAQDAPPDSPDVAQLLFMWGPRPRPAALDWLESRARAAAEPQKALWMQHLLNAGAAKRAVAAGRGQPVTDAYLQAVVAARDGVELSVAIDKRLQTAATASEFRRLGRLALELSRTSTARSAFTKLLTVAPEDAEAHRRLGALDYAESNYTAAREHLDRALRVADADAESQFLLAEILENAGQGAKARPHYVRVLAEIDRAAPIPATLSITRALTLQRLGRIDASIAAFEILIREQPDNKNLRADYAAVLLQSGRNDDGRRILALR